MAPRREYELIHVIKGHTVSTSTRGVPKQFVLYSMHEVERNNRIYNYGAINLYIGFESTAFGFLMCCAVIFFIIGQSTEIFSNGPIASYIEVEVMSEFRWFIPSWVKFWRTSIQFVGTNNYSLHSWTVIIITHHLSRELWQRIERGVWDMAIAVIAFCLLKALNEFGAQRTS